MKPFFTCLFLWSWLFTLPITGLGAYWTYKTVDRFYTYGVRYKPSPVKFNLSTVGQYEFETLQQRVAAATMGVINNRKSSVPLIHLFVPESNLAILESHMPQSGYDYVKARMLINGKLEKVQIKYRGDFVYHWGYDKKSMRVRTTRQNLFQGIRSFNLQAPKRDQQLNTYLGLQLAGRMGLLGPETKLTRLYINGKNEGIRVLVDQLDESTLRAAQVMPGDLYRGEMVGKDKFSGIKKTIKLFNSSAVWDKMAANNHYDLESMAPLDQLLNLIRRRDSPEAQAELSTFLDMAAWGRFSAFEALAHTKHFSKSHNWRLYYDPWRRKISPVVWDPAAWMWRPKAGKRTISAVINSELHQALFLNGDFLRARSAALMDFFKNKEDQDFLIEVDDAIKLMTREIQTDPFLRPGKPDAVIRAMRGLESRIQEVFSDVRNEWADESNTNALYRREGDVLTLAIVGRQVAHKLRFHLADGSGTQPRVYAEYRTAQGMEAVDLSASVEWQKPFVTVHAEFLPAHTIEENDSKKPTHYLRTSPGFYRIRFEGLPPEVRILSAEIDRGEGWLPVESVAELEPATFGSLYAPVAAQPLPEPVVWSGVVAFEGHQTLEEDLIIQPGTTVRLAPGATLVLKGRLLAEGTLERPIRFLSQQVDQAPWGAIVLMGQGANGSHLTHCEMAGGSGKKGALFEYSAMFSVHDVKEVSVKDCLFRDNRVVDDMVHTVYSDIRFERTRFENAFADALDLDISKAVIIDSRFNHSGNDAVDLMTAQADVSGSTFIGNGDKGISVGENSYLFAVDNCLIGNLIGVESKDRSTALLFNQTFKDNEIGLHAYRKNWRYGTGGSIFIAKSTVSGSDNPISAKKESSIHLFDSYLDRPLSSKRITAIAVDGESRLQATQATVLPVDDTTVPAISQALQNLPAATLARVAADRRQAVCNG
jgi:hypothetical protein